MPIRLGFIGAGGIARRHLAVARAHEGAEIAAVCDLDPVRARKAADEFGGEVFTDHRQALERARLDAVVICLPPCAHGEIEIEAASRGLHMFIEKPVALEMATARRVLAAVREAGVITQVGYMYRLCPTVAHIRELLADRPLAMVQAHYFAGGMPNKPWWPSMAGSGGQLIEQATHMVDLGRYLAGEVESVVAHTATVRDWTPPAGWSDEGNWQVRYAEDCEVPDASALLLRYRSGALGTLSCSMVPQASWTNGMTLVADGCRAHIAGPEPDVRWETDDGSGEMMAEEGWSGRILTEFLRAVAGHSQVSVPYEEGMRNLAVSLAGYLSARRGGHPVRLEEVMPPEPA